MATSLRGVGRLGKSFAADLASCRFQFETCQDIIERREVFKTRSLVASRDFDRLKNVLNHWRDGLATGAIQFEPDREKSLRLAFSRWLALAEFLLQMWDDNEVVSSPSQQSLRHRAQTAKRILDDWNAHAISKDVRDFLSGFTRGRSAQELQDLDRLANEAVAKNETRDGADIDAWAERLATDLAAIED